VILECNNPPVAPQDPSTLLPPNSQDPQNPDKLTWDSIYDAAWNTLAALPPDLGLSFDVAGQVLTCTRAGFYEFNLSVRVPSAGATINGMVDIGLSSAPSGDGNQIIAGALQSGQVVRHAAGRMAVGDTFSVTQALNLANWMQGDTLFRYADLQIVRVGR
jgi:hypothetical protein